MVIKLNIWQLVDPNLFVDDGQTPVNQPPSISLASPQAWNYEVWQSIGPVTLNANTAPGTWAPITAVSFFANGSNIHDVPTPIPGWWSEQYVDPTVYTTDTNFTATVTSWSGTTTSGSVNIRFQFRIFRWFNPNTTINEAWIQWLNYDSLENNFPGLYSFTDAIIWQYKYFCYPASLWDLDLTPGTTYAIRDSLNFPVPVQLQWTVPVTNSFWLTQNYNVYRSVNILWGTADWTVIG